MEGRAVLRAVANAVAHVRIFKTQLPMSELASLRIATHSDTYLAHTHIHTYKGQHRACAPFRSCSTTAVAYYLALTLTASLLPQLDHYQQTACSSRWGGANACCAGSITNAGRSCNWSQPPCIMSGSVASVQAPPANQNSVKRSVIVAVLPGPRLSMQQREQKYNIKFDAILMYQSIQQLNWDWVANQLNNGKKVTRHNHVLKYLK
eukprot:13972-Heterococcus_DN1.PRE.1